MPAQMGIPRIGLVAFGCVCLCSITFAGASQESHERSVTFDPCKEEHELAAPLRLKGRTFMAIETPAGDGMQLVQFPTAAVSDHEPNNVVHAELFMPPHDAETELRGPAVIFLHYLDGNLTLPRIFSRSLALGGVTTLLVKMPYYHERRGDSDLRMVTSEPEQTAEAVRQAALDVRYARAYLASRPEVDADRIGIAGISLGGIVGALAFQAEPRLDRGCFLLAGADLPTLLWESSLTSKFRPRWEAVGITRARIESAFAPVDPARYAGRTLGRPVLLMCGKGDDVMPHVCTTALINALSDAHSEPEVVWYGGGHKPAPSDVADSLLRVVAFFAKPDGPPTESRAGSSSAR